MLGSPALSVIIPTYNRAAEIVRAIKSVQGQTLQDLEILVCDDCSTDGTAEIIASLAAIDARVRYLRMPSNGGPAAARNLGISQARAEFLATLIPTTSTSTPTNSKRSCGSRSTSAERAVSRLASPAR